MKLIRCAGCAISYGKDTPKYSHPDTRFTYWTCLECQSHWCRINECPEEFTTSLQLIAHLKRCHLFPIRTEQECRCERPLAGRTNFWRKYIDCSGCGIRVCYVDCCFHTCTKNASLTAHASKVHANPFKCYTCKKQPKIRDGTYVTGQCIPPCKQLWCLSGHCNFETVDQAALDSHAAVCRFRRVLSQKAKLMLDHKLYKFKTNI